MKDLSIIKIVILSAALILSAFFISNMRVKALNFNRSVQVKGLAEREVDSDLAVWPIEVTNSSNNLQSLRSTIESQKQEVIEFFKEFGFSEDELFIGSTNIQDAQANIYGNNGPTPFRYISKTEFTIRTSNLNRLQEAYAASLNLASKGIILGSKNTWQPIEYIFTGLNDIKPIMIEEATKKAREVAEKFAQDSDSEVGKIKSARQGLFSITNRDQNSPRFKVVRVVTTVDYLLKD